MSNIYLVGFMGAGKTAAGRIVADRFGRVFVDLDEAIESRLGRAIREIFETLGERTFRQAETAELERLTSRTDLVVATGGGAFSTPSNRDLIRRSDGVTVFLDPPWDVILDRIRGAAASRPKWIDENHARELYLTRLPDYRLAGVQLALNGDEDPEEVADRVMTVLSEAACAS